MRPLNSSPRRHFYEYGGATVIVSQPTAGTLMDGLVRVKFTCKIHPSNGAPVQEVAVWSFYPFLAAAEAMKIYEKRNPKKQAEDGNPRN